MKKKKGLYILFISSLFLPTSFYYFSIRNSEKKKREKNIHLLYALLWGMIPSVILSFITNMYIFEKLDKKYGSLTSNLITSVIVAPVFEELYKIIGMFFIKQIYKNTEEKEDGLIYGSIIGLGFSLAENIFYSVEYATNITEKISLTMIRQITSTIIHITSTGISGLGVSLSKLQNKNFLYYFYKGVIKHSSHNFIATIPEIISSLFIHKHNYIYDITESKIYSYIFSPVFIIYLIISRALFFKKHIKQISKYDKI
jgi:RsiW-degrading membrane proteinase PrsW (M82 family)